MKTTVQKNTFDNRPSREAALRMRAVDLRSSRTGALVVRDLTHAWDGWLYGALALGSVWPLLRAWGWF
jgi:hypothetical protein